MITGGLWAAAPASAATETWDTPVFGGYDWVVPSGVTSATFDLRGASGGLAGGSIGGKGGKTVATIAVTPGETLKINVGGAGFNAPSSGVPSSTGAGTNGGGSTASESQPCSLVDPSNYNCVGAGGGGASDVRQGGTGLANRVLVAGGGGGAGGHATSYNGTCTGGDSCANIGGGDGGGGGALAAAYGADGADRPLDGGASDPGGCGGEGGTQSASPGHPGTPGDPAACFPDGATGGTQAGTGGTGGGNNLSGGGTGSGTGGGGGGGYIGGGGGNGGYRQAGGGGGGGGSSFAAPAATNVSGTGGVHLGDGRVTVTYTGPAVAPSNATLPNISGTPVAGDTLTCHKGTWNGSAPFTYTYKWLRDNVAITGATSATYPVMAGDAGHALRCRVRASNSAGSASATSAAVQIKTPPKNSVAPKITGTPKVGKTLSCSLGTWTGSAPITYGRQWLRNGYPIPGATGASYVAKAADAGKFLTCKVTATNAAGAGSKASAAVKVS